MCSLVSCGDYLYVLEGVECGAPTNSVEWGVPAVVETDVMEITTLMLGKYFHSVVSVHNKIFVTITQSVPVQELITA